MRKLRFAAMLCVFLGASLAQETGWSQAQTEVWGREEAYWQSLESRDKEAYLPLKDEVFLGWPSYAKSPVRKRTLRERPLTPGRRQLHLRAKSVQVFGETPMTFSRYG